MRFTRTLLALSILGAVPAHAVPYWIVGQLDGINTVNSTINPTFYLHQGSTAYDTSGNQWPTFYGALDINTYPGSRSISGIFADFMQYSVSVNARIGGTAVINQPNLVYSFNGGTVTYDAATRKLTLGQPMVWQSADPGFPVSQTSDATLKFDASEGGQLSSCTGGSMICNAHSSLFLSKPNLEYFYLELVFAPDFNTLWGSAVGVDIGGPTTFGATGNTWYHYSFYGPPMPIPGATWLMGSALMGLAARRISMRNKN